MREENKKCGSCGQEMFEIGGVGREVSWHDFEKQSFGVREVKLYQCPECKNVKLD